MATFTTNYGWEKPADADLASNTPLNANFDDIDFELDAVADRVTSLETTRTNNEAAWGSWTPTWTAWTLGNGTQQAAYLKIGKTLFWRLFIVFGSTSTFVGNPRWSLPNNPVNTNAYCLIGQAQLLDSSASARRAWHVAFIGATAGALPVDDSFTGLNATTPWTWATGDEIRMSGVFECA